MRRCMLAGFLLGILLLVGCAQAERGMTRAEYETMMQTAEGRKSAIQEIYEEAEVLSETEMAETGCIITEFSVGEAHNVMIFKPTENGYFWGEESSYYPENKIGRVFVTVEEEMYDVFLRHTEEVTSLGVMYTHEENAELKLNGKVNFEDSNVGWLRITEMVPQYREELVNAEIAGYNAEGQEISLKNEVTYVEPSKEEKAADAVEDIARRKVFRMVVKGLMG